MEYASLFSHIVKQQVPGQSEADQLLQLTQAHPYFTPAQFFLLQQLNSDEAVYSKQAAKTALLFNNPYWLQFQLQQSRTGAVPQVPTAPVNETPVIAMYADNTDNNDSAVLVEEALPPAAVLTHTPGDTDNESETEIAAAIPTEQAEAPTVEIAANTDNDTAIITNTALPATENQNTADNTDEPEDTKTAQEMPPIKINLAASIKEAENDTALSFEPMHLVDYFASQGIKLSEDGQTADKLGKQLKSFTEWLKTMKKIHADAASGATNADISVQTMAEKSNARGEIVTEAMAEVFAQQGKTGKAIEVYKKLSLLNPLKSAFFAAKIEQLKGS